MPAPKGYPSFHPPPISNEVSGINKFVDLRQRTRDLKARYLPRVSAYETTVQSSSTVAWTAGSPTCSVTVSVREGNFVALYVEGEIYGDLAAYGIYEATDFPLTQIAILGLSAGAWKRFVCSSSGNGNAYPMGSWWVYKPPTIGIKTYYVAHTMAAGATPPVYFRNRRIWAMVL